MTILPTEFYSILPQKIISTETKISKNKVTILLLENVLSQEQCDMIIDLYNSSSPVHVEEEGYNREYRDNYRVLHDDCGLAEYIYDRVLPYISDEDSRLVINSKSKKIGVEASELFSGEWDIVGVNNMFRLCKYETGGKFEKHCDGFYKKDFDNRSFKTIMLYLNNNNAGTVFTEDNVVVTPKTGSVVIFNHYVMHKGETVIGEKYIMRSDIMYTRCESHIEYKETPSYKAALEVELGREQEELGNHILAITHYMKAKRIDPKSILI